MKVELTEYDVWSFRKNEDGEWIWQRHSPDGSLLLESRGAFNDLADCQADAERFGYVLSQPSAV